MHKMSALHLIALILLIIGGLNWGLVGLLEFDLVAAIFGEMSGLSRVIYVLVGLSAVYKLIMAGKMCGHKGQTVGQSMPGQQ